LSKKLHIITTCTNNKLLKVNNKCSLGNYKKTDWRETLEDWRREVLSSSLARVPASSLYCGNHWIKSMASFKTAKEQNLNASLMVLSAGWGFIDMNTEIIPYSSTFSSGDPDSIMNLSWPSSMSNKEKCSTWWRYLHDVRNLKGLCSLGKFAADLDAKSVFLFILSKEYYYAVEQDILEILGLGHDVVIVSAGLYSDITLVSPVIRPNILPVNDKFKQIPGINCANIALNATIANWIIKTHSKALLSGIDKLYKIILNIKNQLPEQKRKIPIKISDEEILNFISKNYSTGESNSASSLLKILRHVEEKSCEQKRFGRLFKKYIKSVDKQGRLF